MSLAQSGSSGMIDLTHSSRASFPSIPATIWARPTAHHCPPRVRGHARLQHRPPKLASSVTWLGESAAIGHSPRGVFFDGTVLPSGTSSNRLPADCRYGRHDRRSSARLPCADGAPPYAAASILLNDCGASLPPTEIIARALIDPILTHWGPASDYYRLRTIARCGFS